MSGQRIIDGLREAVDPTGRWTFRVEQDGIAVAEGDCPDFPTALRECSHYCAMYSQDGAVRGVLTPEGVATTPDDTREGAGPAGPKPAEPHPNPLKSRAALG